MRREPRVGGDAGILRDEMFDRPVRLRTAGDQPAMGSLSFEAHPSGRTQKPWSGPECPSCGSVVTKVGTSGKDMDDRPLRDRRCRDCGASFVTVEAVVPDVKFSEVDVEHKRRARESKRKRFGWTEHRDRQKRLTRKVIVSVRAGAPRRRA